MTLTYDDSGSVIGLRVHETTYSLTALAALTIRLQTIENEREELRARLERAEGEREQLQAELAALQECYADRDQDLAYEYTERMAAKAKAEAWYEVATVYADHEDDCAITPGRPETCTCGYASFIQRAMATGQAPAPASTPHGRLVALGRATLAWADAQRAWQAAVADRTLTNSGGAAAIAARDAAKQAYEAALAAAQEANQ